MELSLIANICMCLGACLHWYIFHLLSEKNTVYGVLYAVMTGILVILITWVIPVIVEEGFKAFHIAGIWDLAGYLFLFLMVGICGLGIIGFFLGQALDFLIFDIIHRHW